MSGKSLHMDVTILFECLHIYRMVIYYPVSALVTLFANVLQNPQDARTRSDIRLMHQVVTFLSVLAVDEETGGVKRMLDVCVEFERIAKIVLEKSEKDSRSGRKRKTSAKDDEEHPPRAAPERTSPQGLNTTPQDQPTPAPSTGLTPSIAGVLSPNVAVGSGPNGAATASTNGGINGSTFSPSPSTTHQNGPESTPMMPEFVPRPGDFPNPFTEFSDMGQFGPGIGSPLNVGFQQPFLPQEMWQMPMNYEWDWTATQGEGQYSGAPEGNGAANGGGNGPPPPPPQANGMR